MDKIMVDDTLDTIGFDDEIDCAIMNDEQMAAAMADVVTAAPATAPKDEEYDIGEDDEIVDVNIDYSDEEHSPDIVDMDADDYIAAEREINSDPFEDDDLIDAASGDDIDIDDIEED